MKKRKIFMAIMLVFLLTGCVKYDLQMEVGTDKSFTLVLIQGMQKEYYSADSGYDEESIAEYEELGYQVEAYEDNDYKGLKLIKNYDNIDSLSSATCSQVELTDLLDIETTDITLFKSQKNGTITTYTADFTYDLSVEESEEEVDYSSYSSSMYFGYTISLPKNATIISSNADSKKDDGYTLTWTIEYGKKKDIDFVFSIDENAVTETKEESKKEEPKKEEDQSVYQVGEEQEEIEVNVSTSTVITFILIIAVIVGLIILKLKTSTKLSFSKKNENDPTILHHTTPPNNKNQN